MACNAKTVTKLIDPISMYFGINMQHHKLLYTYKQNKFTFLVYNNNCLDDKYCYFKVKIVVGMWFNLKCKYCEQRFDR